MKGMLHSRGGTSEGSSESDGLLRNRTDAFKHLALVQNYRSRSGHVSERVSV